jgi:hypothetical protein
MHLPKSLSLLRRMRDARLRQLRRTAPLLAGSLVALPRHSSRYLTDKAAGRTRTLYVPLKHLTEVTRWNEEHKKVRRLVSELSQIQRAILLAEIRLSR